MAKLRPTTSITEEDKKNLNSGFEPEEIDFSPSQTNTAPIGLASLQEETNQSLEAVNKKLLEENEELKEKDKINEEKRIKGINPHDIDPTSVFYNRNPRFFSTPEYFKIRDNIKALGHLIEPVVLRPHPDVNSKYKYQKVVGDTRIHACIDNDMLVDAIVRNYSDQEVAITMISENNARNDRSDIEKGKTFRDLKEKGSFKTQSEIARSCGISESTVSDCLKMLNIPEEVVSAFSNEASLTTSNSRALLRQLKNDNNRQEYQRLAEHLFDLELSDSQLISLFSDLELLRRFIQYKTHDDIDPSERLAEIRALIEREKIEKEIAAEQANLDKKLQSKKEEEAHKKRIAQLEKGPLPTNTRRDITVAGTKYGDFVKSKTIALKFPLEKEGLARYIFENFSDIYADYLKREREIMEEKGDPLNTDH